jgi:lysyl-tRNA synthetase class 2
MVDFAHSSWLKAVDYDAATGRLMVETKTGNTYTYADVPPAIYDGLVTADSAGTYFNAHIQGQYQAPAPEEETPWQLRL